jgi:hypothetical protein
MAKRAPDYFDRLMNDLRPTYNEEGGYDFFDEQGRGRGEVLSYYLDRSEDLDSISNVYQTADKIIIGDNELVVSVVDDKELDTNASNNGREIIFNANLIEDINSDTITSLHGLNYHEVSHILFSPRAGSALGQFIKDNKLVRAFNMLEEGRIEGLMSAKYPSTRLFLEASVTDYVLKGDPDNWAGMFPVITGRTNLDLDIRQAIADKFIKQYGLGLTELIHDIVHSYRVLVFPTDFDKAKELLLKFAEIVGLDDIPPHETPVPTPTNGGCGHGKPILTKGKPLSGKEQERLQKRNGNSPTEKLGDNAGNGAGNGVEGVDDKTITSLDDTDKAIAKKLDERINAIKNDSAVKREVGDTRKAINGNTDTRSTIKDVKCEVTKPNEQAIMYARQFGQELERLVRDSDPNWERFLPSGKLNISRTMNPDVNSISEMFDVWDIGNEATEIEAVLLLDNSGSMGGYMRDVCENAWIIKRGIESIEGKVSVFAFDHETKKMYDRDEKALAREYKYLWARGSTNPFRGLIEAERVLTASDKPIKLAFIVTDGTWSETEECDSVIKRLNDKGVLTIVVFMGDYKQWQEWVEASNKGDEYSTRIVKELKHGAQVFKCLPTPKDVLGLATEIVKASLVVRK